MLIYWKGPLSMRDMLKFFLEWLVLYNPLLFCCANDRQLVEQNLQLSRPFVRDVGMTQIHSISFHEKFISNHVSSGGIYED